MVDKKTKEGKPKKREPKQQKGDCQSIMMWHVCRDERERVESVLHARRRTYVLVAVHAQALNLGDLLVAINVLEERTVAVGLCGVDLAAVVDGDCVEDVVLDLFSHSGECPVQGWKGGEVWRE